MIEESSFGNMLKALRVGKGTERGTSWTQKKTAERLSVSPRTYQKWESGESLPSQTDLKNITKLFQIDKNTEEMLYKAAAQSTPKVHTLPFRRNHFFTGREKQLEQLAGLLEERDSLGNSQPVALSGPGGIGKTQLALEYAHRSYYNGTYQAVFWVRADNLMLQAEYENLAKVLKLSRRGESGPEERVEAVKRWMEERDKWLLVLDNVEDPNTIQPFLPVQSWGGHIILTTHSQIVGTVAKRIEVEKMDQAEGLLLLLKRAGIVQNESELDTIASDIREAATDLVWLLDGYPLALDQAGAYIEETEASLDGYTKLYREKRQEALARRGASENSESEHPASVAATVELSVRKATERQPMAADILYFCSFLYPDYIPEEILLQAEGLATDELAFGESIKALKSYSLIRRNAKEKTFSIHRLVQAVLLDAMPEDLEIQWRKRVLRTLSVAFPKRKPKENGEMWRWVLQMRDWAMQMLIDVCVDSLDNVLRTRKLKVKIDIGFNHAVPTLTLEFAGDDGVPHYVEILSTEDEKLVDSE